MTTDYTQLDLAAETLIAQAVAAQAQADAATLAAAKADAAAALAALQADFDAYKAKYGPAPTPTPDPTPDPTPTPSGKPLVMAYHGMKVDDATDSAVGAKLAGASSYYTDGPVDVAYETSRVKAGRAAFLDFDTKSTPGLIGQIASSSSTGLAWLDAKLKAAEQVATSGGTGRVFIAFVHEWAVKRAQNVLTNTSDRDPATFAKAQSVFLTRAAQLAPHCLPGFWVGGGAGTRTVDAQVLAGVAGKFAWFSWDPYVTKNGAIKNAEQLWTDWATWIRANPTYKAMGTPPLYVTETGIDKAHGDTACAAFYTGWPAVMTKLGIAGAIAFLRDKTDNNGAVVAYDITTGSTKALAALRASATA